MRISLKIAQAEKEDRIWWSFEYFPPRTAQGLQNLLDRIERMRGWGPEFIDITWNAGGRTSELTSELVKLCQKTIGIETCMHLTCTNMPKDKVDIALREAKGHGCRNILALRGDPPAGRDEWEAVEGGFVHGSDLVRHIQSNYDDYFDVAVPGFPQTILLPPDELELEMKHLKEKIDLGCAFIFTQMFYDFEVFARWVKAVRAYGITVPIVPGIMPIQTWNGFQRATSLAQTIIPEDYQQALEPHKNDDEQVRAIGTRLVADLCRKVLESDLGIKGLHFYTMNLEMGTKMLLEELGLVPRIQTIKPLPWRQCLTPTRRTENIRPIFWANRTHSYISRTENWDEYPNGRFGDSRSPAYGELDGYGVSMKQTKKDALKLWGKPTSFSQIAALFSSYCNGTLHALPWCDQRPSKETSAITSQLARMNSYGFLTINSQPAVNGARSDDPIFGWGPTNGYVYQKAYLEFFVSPALLSQLLPLIERDPNFIYYAINRYGDLRTNNRFDGPNAVTWGVFPGKEIVQPTIVEAVSFMAWKDEAFELGMQWSKIYESGSESRQLIKEVMESFFLVNVVHNNFHDRDAIFAPFFKAGDLAGLESAADVTPVSPTSAIKPTPVSPTKTNGSAIPNGNGHGHGNGNGHAIPDRDVVEKLANGINGVAIASAA